MQFLISIVFAVIANGLALFAADRFVEGFVLATGDLKAFAIVTLILTVLNFVLKPVLKLLLGPIIILTLGLGAILVNAVILKVLDFLSPALSIQGLVALLYATLIVTAINFVFHLITRK